MKETGHILKEHREKSGLTIHEVSLALKINPRIIKAIEEGDQSQLPPRTFLRGFVQSYASYLKLDMEIFMTTFNREMGVRKPEMKEASTETAEPTNHSEQAKAETAANKPDALGRMFFWLGPSSKMAKVLVGIIAVCILLAIVVIKRTIDKYQQESQVFAPPENVHSLQLKDATGTEAATTPPPSTETAPATEPKALPVPATPSTTTSGTAAPVPAPGSGALKQSSTATPTTAQPGPKSPATSVPGPTAKPAPTSTQTQTTNPPPRQAQEKSPAPAMKNVTPPTPAKSANVGTKTPVEPAKTTPPKPEAKDVKAQKKPEVQTAKLPLTKPAADASKQPIAGANLTQATKSEKLANQEIILEALDKVTAEVQIDDGATQTVNLASDQIRTIKAKHKIKLKLSDGGAVSIIYNGKDKGVPGDLGQPLSLSFPK